MADGGCFGFGFDFHTRTNSLLPLEDNPVTLFQSRFNDSQGIVSTADGHVPTIDFVFTGDDVDVALSLLLQQSSFGNQQAASRWTHLKLNAYK